MPKTESPTQGHGCEQNRKYYLSKLKPRGRAVHLASSALPSSEYRTPTFISFHPYYFSMLTVSRLTPPMSKNFLLPFSVSQQQQRQMSHQRDQVKPPNPLSCFINISKSRWLLKSQPLVGRRELHDGVGTAKAPRCQLGVTNPSLGDHTGSATGL